MLPYDYLVYALGSFGDADAIPGGRDYAFTLGDMDASRQLGAKLRENPNARVTVVGGGMSGIELSTEIAETYPGVSMTLLEREQLGPNFRKRGTLTCSTRSSAARFRFTRA